MNKWKTFPKSLKVFDLNQVTIELFFFILRQWRVSAAIVAYSDRYSTVFSDRFHTPSIKYIKTVSSIHYFRILYILRRLTFGCSVVTIIIMWAHLNNDVALVRGHRISGRKRTAGDRIARLFLSSVPNREREKAEGCRRTWIIPDSYFQARNSLPPPLLRSVWFPCVRRQSLQPYTGNNTIYTWVCVCVSVIINTPI